MTLRNVSHDAVVEGYTLDVEFRPGCLWEGASFFIEAEKQELSEFWLSANESTPLVDQWHWFVMSARPGVDIEDSQAHIHIPLVAATMYTIHAGGGPYFFSYVVPYLNMAAFDYREVEVYQSCDRSFVWGTLEIHQVHLGWRYTFLMSGSMSVSTTKHNMSQIIM